MVRIAGVRQIRDVPARAGDSKDKGPVIGDFLSSTSRGQSLALLPSMYLL
ncbi:hypothetical protein Sjap_006723 [Stephania japonica]|uniref:Uncharacterized protein n=1 Tax=Stephania japonica TaxID=461633 RepID=A0AAP0K8Z2_9MAGN